MRTAAPRRAASTQARSWGEHVAVLPSKKDLLKTTVDNVDQLKDLLHLLAAREVLVGFPEDTTGREPSPDEPQGLTNAALGYIHDTGAPEQNIPARPFMLPGMAEAEEPVTKALAATARQLLNVKGAGPAAIDQGLHRAGLKAQFALRRKINEGIPPPLSEMTLRNRARKGRKGAKKELELRAQGEAPSTEFAKPLIDTGQLRNAINYVIRDRKKRKG